MTDQEKNPFTSFYERVNQKASVKGILSPDITVKYENAEDKTVIRFDKELEFEVSGTENQKVVKRCLELLIEWIVAVKSQGFQTCFDENEKIMSLVTSKMS